MKMDALTTIVRSRNESRSIVFSKATNEIEPLSVKTNEIDATFRRDSDHKKNELGDRHGIPYADQTEKE